MKAIRWTAIVATGLMALANIPTAFTASDGDTASWSKVPATVLGFLGIVVIVALVRRLGWGAPAAAALGVFNVAGGVAVMADGYSSGSVGVVLGGITAVSAGVLARGTAATALIGSSRPMRRDAATRPGSGTP